MSSDMLQDDNMVIHNPVTGSNYTVRDHSSKYDPKKVIKGLWKKDFQNIEKNIDVKGSRIDDLNTAHMFIPLKLRKACRKLSSGVESALRGSLEKIGVAFSVGGAAFVAMPATMFNTFATNAFFFIGDIFLLSIFALEKRNWLIVQNFIFAVLAAWGIFNNLPGVL